MGRRILEALLLLVTAAVIYPMAFGGVRLLQVAVANETLAATVITVGVVSYAMYAANRKRT